MPSDSDKAIYKRYEAAKEGRGIWEETWQELSEFILPRKSVINTTPTPGEKRTKRLFDSTAIHANELLASAIQSTLTPSSALWFMGKVSNKKLMERQDVAVWCYDVAVAMWEAIKNSNFRSESFETFLDLPALGIGSLYADWDDELYFRSFFVGDFSIEEDAKGNVSAIYRESKITIRQAHELWEDKIPQHMKDKLNSSPDEEVDIVHAVMKRGTLGKFKTKKPIASYYLDVKTKSVIDEGGYDEMPYAIGRWSKVSGEKYGRGPGNTAIPDIRTLNRAKELILKKWNKDIDPPIDVPDEGISGQYKTFAGAINYVRPDLLGKIRQHEFNVNLNENQINVQELKLGINQIFLVDQLKLRDGPQKTAREVDELVDQMQRLIGPALSRQEIDLLKVMLMRVYGLMERRGKLPEKPDILKDEVFDVEFIGPLAKAQRQNEVASVDRWLAQTGGMAEINQNVLDIPNWDLIVRRYAELDGVPPDLINDEDTVKDNRNQRSEAQSQAEQKEMGMELVKGAMSGQG
ncbi:MAG: head-tail connector protein [Proteobacteria bacterium]|nr:head-tail connector protein [Pseudomonadota bacterium]